MKKNTSTPSKYLRLALLLPLLTFLLYSFSTKVPVYTSQDDSPRIAVQDCATSEMVAEYNTLAAKYNAMSKDNFRVLGQEVDRMRHIYNLMSASQKAEAEPFPTLPKPPAPPAPLAMEDVDPLEDEEEISIDTAVEYEIETDVRTEEETDIEIEESVEAEEAVEAYESEEAAEAEGEMEYEIRRDIRKVRKNKVEDQSKNKNNRKIKNKNIDEKDRVRHTKKHTMVYTTTRDSATTSNKNRDFTYKRSARGIPAPPTPPGAAGPSIDIKDLARREAAFYLEGKEVSAEEAMEFIENTQQIKLRVQDNKGKKPVVRLSSGGS